MDAGGGAVIITGVCICKKLGSFWNSMIFSAMGVAGTDMAVVVRGVISNVCPKAEAWVPLVCVCERDNGAVLTWDWFPEGIGALSFRRRSLIVMEVDLLGGGEAGCSLGAGGDVEEDGTDCVGGLGRGPAGGGKGLIVFAGGIGDAGIVSSLVDCGETAVVALPLDDRRCVLYSGSSGRGGSVVDGGGFKGATIDSRNVRWATELRNEDLGDELGLSSRGFSTSWAALSLGAGGRADVGAGRGGGMDMRCDEDVRAGWRLDATDAACEYVVLNECCEEPDARFEFENDGRLDTTLFSLLCAEPFAEPEPCSAEAYGWTPRACSCFGTAGGGSDGGVKRLGRIPCLDHRRALLIPELRFVLVLDRSTLIAFSPDPYVDTDCSDGARGRCSGVPNWNPFSESACLSVDTRSVDVREAVKLTRRTESALGVSDVACSRLPVSACPNPDDVHRLRGGGCNDIAPSKNPLFDLRVSLLDDAIVAAPVGVQEVTC